MAWELHEGDCLTVLKEMSPGTVQTCITSPPYWGLRDYGTNGQLGLEETPEKYIANMVRVFREVKRVLRDDGTLWVNLGDTYIGGGRGGGGQKQQTNRGSKSITNLRLPPCGAYKQKDLVGIPWRVAFALHQPYHSGPIKDERDRLWLAALTDGEGCLTILETTSSHDSGNSYPGIFQIRMTDVLPITKTAIITGYGNASPPQEPPSQGGQRPSYQWRVNGRKAADIAAELYPYLLVKKKQALVLWNHQAVRESYHTKNGVKVPKDAVEKQLLCRDIIRRLNDGTGADIPTWMVEPPRLEEQGWYLRSDCIWHKPNPMPESVTDRPTRAHEYIFLLSKNKNYYYDHEAIKERCSESSILDFQRRKTLDNKGKEAGTYEEARPDLCRGREAYMPSDLRRNKRSVWTVTPQPFAGAHFATFPPKLIEPCVLAGCPPQGTILDPFAGAGTTLLVSEGLGRNSIGIEINPEYCEIIKKRMVGRQSTVIESLNEGEDTY